MDIWWKLRFFWGVQRAILNFCVQKRCPKIASKRAELWDGRVLNAVNFWGVQKAILVFFVQTRAPKISSKPTDVWGGRVVEVVIFWGVQKAILNFQMLLPALVSRFLYPPPQS